MKKIAISLFLILTFSVYAQPELDLKPDKIEFEDVFNRLENVLLINKGDQDLIIDTIRYNKDLYFVRFDREWKYPLTIAPGDTVIMDCLLANYFLVTSQDTTDTMKIFYSDYNEFEDLKIKIKYFDDDDKSGIVTGTVTDSNGTVPNAKISFYYERTYLLDSAFTDSQGQFTKSLPEGEYIIVTEKEGYYLNFYNNKFDSYDADILEVDKDSTINVNIRLVPKLAAANKVSGRVIDFVSNAVVRKGIIVVRKGKHTPTKLSPALIEEADSIKSYTGQIKSDGTFVIDDIILPGYYYIQAFSDFYLPAYTSNNSQPAIFWQQTDSVFIQNTVENQTIVLKRDSSYGGGIISGKLYIDSTDTNSALQFSDIIVFAENVDYQEVFYYTIPLKDGSFEINRLPYGRYRLIAQSIGYKDAVSSSIFDINPTQTIYTNAKLNFVLTSVKSNNHKVVDKFELYQNYPNPFNPTTTIKYSIPQTPLNPPFVKGGKPGGLVSLKIYNLLGREIKTLVDKKQAPGTYSVEFNARNLPSGIYVYQLSINGFVKTKKMILLK